MCVSPLFPFLSSPFIPFRLYLLFPTVSPSLNPNYRVNIGVPANVVTHPTGLAKPCIIVLTDVEPFNQSITHRIQLFPLKIMTRAKRELLLDVGEQAIASLTFTYPVFSQHLFQTVDPLVHRRLVTCRQIVRSRRRGARLLAVSPLADGCTSGAHAQCEYVLLFGRGGSAFFAGQQGVATSEVDLPVLTIELFIVVVTQLRARTRIGVHAAQAETGSRTERIAPTERVARTRHRN